MKKRDWIKNVAIIFLAVMLVLVFFSNTIMNRSLPEVSGQYVSSGSISAKIRGSGTVTATESYDVVLNQTRTVAAVNVKVGDPVSTGDLLFTLGEAESQELTAAQEELSTLLLSYEKALVQAGGGGESLEIRYAREDLAAAQEVLKKNVYKEQELTDAQTRVTSATQYRDNCQTQVDLAQANLDALGGLQEGDNSAYNAKQKEINNKKNELEAAKIVHKTGYEAFEADVDAAMEAAGFSKDKKSEWNSKRPIYVQVVLEGLPETDAKRVAAEAILKLEKEIADLEAQRDQLWTSDNSYQYSQLSKKLSDAKTTLASAQAELTAAENALKTIEEKKAAWQAANEQVKTCQKNLETLLINAQVTALDLQDMQRQVQEKRDAVAKLEADSTGGKVTSPVNGVVRQINVSAGNNTESGSPMAVIEVPDRGYSLSFPVTVEQSKKVKVGDTAEVSGGWWYGGDITATLTGIRNDPDNPNQSRLLSFALSGEVESGSQLSLVLGQRSQDYEFIVPNSALHSDTNGDFVYVAAVKSSPLGNRYVATRIDVQVLAKDDMNSAVSGGLTGSDYVITTTAKPLEKGMLVRLAENI